MCFIQLFFVYECLDRIYIEPKTELKPSQNQANTFINQCEKKCVCRMEADICSQASKTIHSFSSFFVSLFFSLFFVNKKLIICLFFSPYACILFCVREAASHFGVCIVNGQNVLLVTFSISFNCYLIFFSVPSNSAADRMPHGCCCMLRVSSQDPTKELIAHDYYSLRKRR